jgi:hypothetical protein
MSDPILDPVPTDTTSQPDGQIDNDDDTGFFTDDAVHQDV